MSSLMDVPNLNQRVHRVTVEFYHQLTALGLVKKQTELIRGVIVNKMSKSPLHGITARRLFQKLLSLMPSGFTARIEQGACCTIFSAVVPIKNSRCSIFRNT